MKSTIFLCLFFGFSLLACMQQDPSNQAERTRLGKSDVAGGVVGSCLTTSDSGDSCGVQSESGCWCDDLCEDYGDCCGDIIAVCNSPDQECSTDADCKEIACPNGSYAHEVCTNFSCEIPQLSCSS